MSDLPPVPFQSKVTEPNGYPTRIWGDWFQRVLQRLKSDPVTGGISQLTGDVAAEGPGSVTATIQPGVITNSKISASAGISYSKLAALPSANILVGNGSNVPTAVPVSGDIAISNTGATSYSGTVPLNKGGTGQTTKSAAFDALSPMSAEGDLIYGGAGGTGTRLPKGDEGQVLKLSSGIPAWDDLPAGEENLVLNPDAEIDTSDTSTYKDAAGTAPVDGTEGSPTLTLTRSTSSPIAGVASFLITKPASNTQGEGAAWACMPIEPKYRAKVLQLSFEYMVVSGAFVAGTSTTDSDITIWAILSNGVTTTVKQLTTYRLYANSTTISSTFIGNFQTDYDTTSMSIVAHCSTSATNAFVLKIDDLKLSICNYVYGTPISDWRPYTPTFNSGFTVGTGGLAQSSWFYRRVGQNLEITGGIYLGTSGASMGTGFLSMTIPDALTFDENYLAMLDDHPAVGVCRFGDNSAASSPSGLVLIYNGSPNTLIFGTSTYSPVAATTPWTWAANDFISVTKISVPIQGWSSSVQMSDNSDCRAVVMQAFKNTGSIANATVADVTSWNSNPLDTHGGMDISSGEYRIPVSGYYNIKGKISWADNGTGGRIHLIVKNGTIIAESTIINTFSADRAVTVSDVTCYCSANDIIKLQAYQSSGGSLAYDNTNSYCSSFSVTRISNPQTLSAIENVSALYYDNNTGGALATGGTTMPTATREWDSHGQFNTSTMEYNCIYPGEWEVGAMVIVAAQSRNAGNATFVGVWKNASIVRYFAMARMSATATQTMEVSGTTKVRCNANDKLKVVVYPDTNTSLYSSASPAGSMNWVSFRRVGN